MKCDNCLHKEVCTHRINMQNGMYGYMRYNFDSKACANYIDINDINYVVHGHVIKKKRVIGGFETEQCPYCFCKRQKDNRTEVEEWLCSQCGKVLSENYQNYCPHCGAKIDETEEEKENGRAENE